MKKVEKLFEKGIEFIKKIKNKKVFLIHHTDVDGLASAALTFIALKRTGIKVSKVVARSVDERKKISDDLKKCKKAIILDIPLENFEELKKTGKEILIIDHHPSTVINTKKIVCINPRIVKKDIYQPTSYLVYKLFSKVVNLKDKEWLSVLGTLADFGFEDCKDLLKKWIKIKRKSSILKTRFWKIAKMVKGSSFKLKEEEIIRILISSKNLNKLEKNEKILKAFKKYKKILKKGEKEFWKNAEEFKKLNLIISRISEKVGSELASEISARFPDKIIILLEKSGKEFKIHARYQNARIHLGKLLKKICGGGGHKQAAGGKIPVKEFENFKKKLLKECYTYNIKEKN